jgi:AraC-like DNA-binding protein
MEAASMSRFIQTFSLDHKSFCWSGIGMRATAAADRNMAAHRHSFFQVFFVARGSAVHEIGGRVFQGTTGSIFFVRPYAVHRVAFPADAECYVLYFSPEFMQQSFGVTEVRTQESDLYRLPELAPFLYQDACVYQLAGGEIDAARQRCLRIGALCETQGPYDSAEARAELTLLLTMVARKYQAEFGRAAPARDSGHLVDRRARTVLAYLREHFRRALTLPMVAREVSLTGTYLTQLLKQETGKSFKQLLDEIRLENCKTLLAYTDAPLQKVAADSGFSDQAQFARRFKAYAGETPRKFRLAHHKRAPAGEAPH